MGKSGGESQRPHSWNRRLRHPGGRLVMLTAGGRQSGKEKF
jgi:hypothetical protein